MEMGVLTEGNLARVPTFEAREEILARLSPYLSELRYKRGQEIDMWSRDSSLYYVLEGKVEVSFEEHEARNIMAIIGQGEFFGEVGFMDGITRVGHIKSTRDSVLLRLSRGKFAKLRVEDPHLFGDVVQLISLSICRKFRQVTAESRPLGSYSAILSSGRVPLFGELKAVPDNVVRSSLWRKVTEEVESFKAVMYQAANDIQTCADGDLFDRYYTKVKELIDHFDSFIEALSAKEKEDPETMKYVWGFIFKEIFPYFMRSRFAQRAYFKPKGYAGDFLMMEAIYRNEPDGDGLLGLLVDRYCLDTPPARAVRERRRLLSDIIEEEVERRISWGLKPGETVRIMNLACGSNRELFDFLKRSKRTDAIEALCIDADKDALKYTAEKVDTFPHDASIMLVQENVIKWSLGRSRYDFSRQDIIYSAGLTDYLDERLFTALVKKARGLLRPGGVLILSNFSVNNPNKAWMDHMLQWKLIHRTDQDLKRMFVAGGLGKDVEVFHEREGVNLFAIGRKEA